MRLKYRKNDLSKGGEKSRYYEPDAFGPRHALIARLHGAGLTNKQIAAALQMNEARVSTILTDRRAAAFVREASERVADNILDINERLKLHAAEALDEIVDQMRNSPKEQIRQKASFGILDRAGYTPVQRHRIIQAPELPEEIASRVEETHTELREVVRTVRYAAPDPAPAPARDVTDLSEGGVQ